MAVTELRDGRWICYWRVRGPDNISRIKKEYFGRGTKAQARAIIRHQELGLKHRRPSRMDLGPTFRDLARTYTENKNFSENSRTLLKIRLEANILPFLGNKTAIKIMDQDLDDYVSLRRKSVKDATIAREITDIKAILNWSTARRPKLIPFNPVANYQKPAEDNAVIMPPTPKETARILAHASPHLVRAILLSYYLGLRPGAVELLSLKWRQVSWDSKTILVNSAHKGGPVKRSVPIHENLMPLLTKWRAEDKNTKYLIHYHGHSIKSIKTAWKGALASAKITRRIRLYDLRHHFVTAALEAGADIKALSEIVGSSPQTLMRHYQHVTSEMHRQTIAKIPKVTILSIPSIPKKQKRPTSSNRP